MLMKNALRSIKWHDACKNVEYCKPDPFDKHTMPYTLMRVLAICGHVVTGAGGRVEGARKS